jgi:hypothetical protein
MPLSAFKSGIEIVPRCPGSNPGMTAAVSLVTETTTPTLALFSTSTRKVARDPAGAAVSVARVAGLTAAIVVEADGCADAGRLGVGLHASSAIRRTTSAIRIFLTPTVWSPCRVWSQRSRDDPGGPRDCGFEMHHTRFASRDRAGRPGSAATWHLGAVASRRTIDSQPPGVILAPARLSKGDAAMTTYTQHATDGVRSTLGRAFKFLFLMWLGIQTASIAFALRRRRDVIETPTAASDEIALSSIFGGLDFTSTAASLRGGTLSCLYGGGILDLRSATVVPGGANLRVQALFGGAQILVPASWRLETKVIGPGGVVDGRPRIDRPSDAPVLRLEGWTVFGGFSVATDGPKGREVPFFEPADGTHARIVEGMEKT